MLTTVRNSIDAVVGTMDIHPGEAGQYRVDMYDRTTTKGGKPTLLQYALRLLAHGTFGADMNQIEDFVRSNCQPAFR